MKKILHIIFVLIIISSSSVSNAQSTHSPLVAAVNNFAFDLYNKISSPPKNLVVSPYSLTSVLAILATGAAGETRTQILTALHLSDNQNNFFVPVAVSPDENFIIANALWAQKGLNYKKDFLAQLKNIKTINFYNVNYAAPEKSRKTINDWVVQKTKGKITDLIPAGAIDTATRLVIINAIYFRGDWLHPFSTDKTQSLSFSTLQGNKINVPMMEQLHNFSYAENSQWQMLQLPYAKNNLAMIVLLPKTATQPQINAVDYQNLLMNLQQTEVQVFLPKFKINTTLDNLTTTLQAMGITNAFSGQADFSNLAEQPLYVSLIIQKAMIDVDEKGTTAAAATGAVMRLTAMVEPTPPKMFRADHPFMFLIYDTQAKVILFMGQVVNPVA